MLQKNSILLACFALLLSLHSPLAHSQDVLDDLDEGAEATSATSEAAPNLATEKIKNISSSKKIFIISNENQSFAKGDFISLLIANQLVARALVAKTTETKLSGIKIVKIYNLNLWKQLNPGKDILILKGDDSYFSRKEKVASNEKSKDKKGKDNLVQSEEDLFNSTTISGNDDDLTMEETSKRLIKPDNVLSLNVGMVEGLDVDGSTKRFTQLNASWAYQLTDNVWAEAGIGTNTVTDYPYVGLDTRLTNITVRAKYTINAPFYSYLMPYAGYQTILASSPGAGVDPGDGSRTSTELQQELQMVDEQKKSTPIFGVTILKRIVPGWFLRADLGTDILNGGLSIEF